MNEMDPKLACRICLSNSNMCSNIYACQPSHDAPIYEVINYVYDLEITIGDGLPENVCTQCLEIIRCFENYKRKAHSTKRELLSTREKSNVHIKTEDDDFLDINDDNVSSVEQYHEPQVEIHESCNYRALKEEETKDGIVTKDVQQMHERTMDGAQSMPWSDNMNYRRINYMEYHESDSIQYSNKEEPPEEENVQSYGNGNCSCYSVDMETNDRGTGDGERSRVSVKKEVVEEVANLEEYASCLHCGLKKATEAELKEHVYRDHSSIYATDGIGEGKKHGFELAFQCEKNIKTVTEHFRCNACEYSTAIESQLMEHMQLHNRENPFKCNICKFSASDQFLFGKHLLTHTQNKRFKCHLCEYSSASKSHLRNHMYKHGGEKPYKCQLCQYSTAVRSNLTTHMFTHTGEKPFKCSLCDYRTSVESQLRPHMYTHTGERPYRCKLCDYCAITTSNLKAHMYTHSGEKPFKCNLCDYSSAVKRNLRSHVLKHTGEKPFKCTQCEYGSGRESQVRRHMLTHSSDKQLQCSQCNYRTAFKKDMVLHKRTHSGMKRFRCSKCDYSATKSSYLEKHMFKHQ